MELVLIRHPAVAIKRGICYGRSEVPLAGDARAEADALLERLKVLAAAAAPVTALAGAAATETQVARRRMSAGGRLLLAPSMIATSPLMRCMCIAARLGERIGCSITPDVRLCELDFGRWELQRWEDLNRDALDAWARDLEYGRPHGGESVRRVIDRVSAWLAQAQAASDEETHDRPYVVWAISHAGPIRLLTAYALALPATACTHWPLAMGGMVWLRNTASASSRMPWALGCWNR
ncbi:Alpha-ribazole phosphatase (Alpha-ribazole-5'-phosphate phosphatase), cobC [Candidatus Glomeribacter gigasporarum BEG34]|uniref:Alpha-ribazole phosphatase (Alpha-ribazole-5'-phosphate phosphatase), cobC n=1 Tax=Candidatus Glomeribacter gigasporarum BEG34 TaxID=1070319 RepID=G2JAL9_9BURK|nr:histidine phosphatase family protein [Candidatus Glomeribacter gigasporarum]CCD29821.1 Alpha-ribazole phosphatase (Alpha-ribazole-5'-phosphate phosphatase), cobC [Candidatus Glomeribacter gigasporarum BEG34]